MVTNGSNVPSISSTLPNPVQNNITRVGTITNGTWEGTTVAVDQGGTGRTTHTAHGILIGDGTNAIKSTAVGSAGQVLQSGGAGSDPTYSNAVYPASTTANQLLYSSATNTIAGLTTANNSATPIPPTTLKKIKELMVASPMKLSFSGMADPRAEIRKRTAARMSPFFRPIPWLIYPPRDPPIMQPTRALEIVYPLMELPSPSLSTFSPLKKKK